MTKISFGQYRQGDVLLVPTELSRFSKFKNVARNDGRKVLAEGELTGHAHVANDNAQLVEIDGTLYLVVDEPGTTITHEEHPTIEVPAGEYRVQRQRQYNPEKVREWDWVGD
jgi:hypothetical protein